MATAMAHLPAFLIVLTLTGEPVANALCINWCDIPSERQHCGDVIAQPFFPMILAAGSTCAALVTAGPFLREEKPGASVTAVARETSSAVDTRLGEAGLVNLRASGDATRGRRTPGLVLRE